MSNGKPYCYSSVSFSLLLLFFFVTRFLQNAWTDFHEIFRDGVSWPRKTKNNFSCDDITSVLRFDNFLILRVVILWPLSPPKRLKMSTSIFYGWSTKVWSFYNEKHKSLGRKAPKRGRARKLSFLKSQIFSMFFSDNLFTHKYFVITCRTKVV